MTARETRLKSFAFLSLCLLAAMLCLTACNTASEPEQEGEGPQSTIWFEDGVVRFDKVPLGSFKTLNYTIRNQNFSETSILVKARVEGTGYAIIGDTTRTLAPGASLVLSIRFTPAALPDPEGMLIVTHTATDVHFGDLSKTTASGSPLARSAAERSANIPLIGSGEISTPPETPAPRMPADSSADAYTAPTEFSWAPAIGASSYTLEVSTSSAFSLIVATSTTSDTTSKIQSLAIGNTYYWRVKATNTNGASEYSPVRVFTTIPRPGEAWNIRNSGSFAHLARVAWCQNHSFFIAVGSDGTILTSPDGITWTSHFSGTTASLNGVTCGSDLIVAVGENGTVVTSSDASNWNVNTLETSSLNGVAWSGSSFVAVGDNGLILTSPTGTTWTQRTSGTGNFLTSVRWIGSGFVAVGHNVALRSSTGTSWTIPLTGAGTLRDVVYADSRYLISGNNNIWEWNGGSDWERSTPLSNDNIFFSIASSGSRYVVVGNDGLIQSSPDGWWTWSSRSSGTINTLTSVAWSGSRFIAVGDNGTIVSSP